MLNGNRSHQLTFIDFDEVFFESMDLFVSDHRGDSVPFNPMQYPLGSHRTLSLIDPIESVIGCMNSSGNIPILHLHDKRSFHRVRIRRHRMIQKGDILFNQREILNMHWQISLQRQNEFLPFKLLLIPLWWYRLGAIWYHRWRAMKPTVHRRVVSLRMRLVAISRMLRCHIWWQRVMRR